MGGCFGKEKWCCEHTHFPVFVAENEWVRWS